MVPDTLWQKPLGEMPDLLREVAHQVIKLYDIKETAHFSWIPKFIIRDASGHLLEEKNLDEMEAGFSYFQDMIQLSNGDWLGTGVNLEPENPGDYFLHAYAWICRLDLTIIQGCLLQLRAAISV